MCAPHDCAREKSRLARSRARSEDVDTCGGARVGPRHLRPSPFAAPRTGAGAVTTASVASATRPDRNQARARFPRCPSASKRTRCGFRLAKGLPCFTVVLRFPEKMPRRSGKQLGSPLFRAVSSICRWTPRAATLARRDVSIGVARRPQ